MSETRVQLFYRDTRCHLFAAVLSTIGAEATGTFVDIHKAAFDEVERVINRAADKIGLTAAVECLILTQREYTVFASNDVVDQLPLLFIQMKRAYTVPPDVDDLDPETFG